MKKKRYYLNIACIVSIMFLFSCIICSGLSYAESSKALYPLAKKEGMVSFAGNLAAEMMAPLLKAFEEKYPGVQIKYLRKSTGPLLSLVETERMADKISFDVVMLSDESHFIALHDKGYWQKYKVENWDDIDEKFKEKNGYFTTMNVSAMVGGYNPLKIKPSEAPKTYRDFLLPKFKNMMSSSSPGRGGSGMSAVLNVLHNYGWDFVYKLKANGNMCVRGHGSVVRMLVSGERPIAWEISAYRALDQNKKGSPLNVIWFEEEGLPIYLNDMGIPAKAPHPNAGKLLANFLVSLEGQELMVKHVNRWSILSDISAVPYGCKPLSQTKYYRPPLHDIVYNGPMVAQRWDEIFGLK